MSLEWARDRPTLAKRPHPVKRGLTDEALVEEPREARLDLCPRIALEVEQLPHGRDDGGLVAGAVAQLEHNRRGRVQVVDAVERLLVDDQAVLDLVDVEARRSL